MSSASLADPSVRPGATAAFSALRYGYGAMRAACAEFGIAVHEAAIPSADVVFAAAGLSQEQVDAVTRLYAWNMAHYFKPSTYTRRQRLQLALHFLLGWA